MREYSEILHFNDFFTNYHMRLVRFANTYVRDLSSAEDIVLESFMVYWENRSALSEGSNILAYILTIVKNKCLNYLQHKKMQERVLFDMQNHASWEMDIRIATLEACNPSELFSSEVDSIIKEALATLPNRTLEVFRMSRYQDKSHKEIAEILGVSTKGVEFHITKALSVLRSRLKDYMLFIL